MSPTDIENLRVRMTGDGSSYQRMLSSAQAQTDSVSKSIERSSSRVQAMGFGLRRFALSAMGALAPLTGMISAIGGAFKSVSLAAAEEDTQISFTTMLQSAEKAKKMTESLQQFAADTPLDSVTIQTAAKMLLQYQVAGDKIVETLTMLGDVAGGKPQELLRISRAYGQMASASRVTNEEINQMIDAGFNPLTEMSKRAGLSVGVLREEISKGKIPMEELNASIKAVTSQGGMFYEAMKSQSRGLNGLFSTMKDDMDAFYRVLGKNLIELLKLKEVVMAVSAAAQSLTKWLKELHPETKQFVTVLVAAAGAAMFFAVAWPIMASLGTAAITAMVVAIDILLGPINILGIAIVAIGVAWVRSLGGVENAWELVKQKALEVWESLKPARDSIKQLSQFGYLIISNFDAIAAGVREAITPAIEEMIVYLEEAYDSVVELKDIAVEWVNTFVVENRRLIIILTSVVASVLAVIGAVKAGIAIFGILKAVFVALKVQQILSTAAWVVWTGVLFAAKIVMGLFNAQLAMWQFLLGTSTAASGIWTIGVMIAKAATWLWNAALAVMNSLLAPAAILAFAGTVAILTAAFVIVAGAAMAVWEAGNAVLEILEELPTTTGPISAITGLFKEWYDILRDVFKVVQEDSAQAWRLLSAGFNLAVSQIKDLWPPLWTFLEVGFKAVGDVVADNFEISLFRAIANISGGILQILDIFGMVTDDIQKELDEINKIAKKTNQLGIKIAKGQLDRAVKNFKVVESDATKAARGEVDKIRKDIGDGVMSPEKIGEIVSANAKAAIDATMAEMDKGGDDQAKKWAAQVEKASKVIATNFDAAAFGSAEARSRITAFKDLISGQRAIAAPGTWRPSDPTLAKNQPNERNTANTEDTKILGQIRDGIQKLNQGDKDIVIGKADL